MRGKKLALVGVSFTSSILFLSSCTQTLERNIEAVKRDIATVRSTLAEHDAQMEDMNERVRELTGRLEEMEYAQARRIGAAMSDLKNQVRSLEARVPPPKGVPEEFLNEDQNALRSLPPEIAERFSKALSLIREARFHEAVPFLQSAIEEGQGHSVTANILFWVGVSYDSVKDAKNALRAFNELVTSYPKASRAPAALLAQGKIFRALGDDSTATITFKKLVKDYPASEEASSAKSYLK
jgi:TolA-binding protein